MESFSLLKYWRGGGGSGATAVTSSAATTSSTSVARTKTITATAAVEDNLAIMEANGDVSDNDEGPFFDLEFALPSDVADICSDNEDATEVDLVTGDGLQAECLSLSPSNELLFKGKLVFSGDGGGNEDTKPQIAAGILKSATKLRVLLLGFKKPNKFMAAEQQQTTSTTAKQQQLNNNSSKFFIKFKIEEVPLVSLFTRDNSSRSVSSTGPKLETADGVVPPTAAATADEKKFAKETMQKYINKIKPLYIRVSRRYAEKLKISGLPSAGEIINRATSTEKENNAESIVADKSDDKSKPTAVAAALPAGLKVVKKKLGKSKSASSAVAAAPSPALSQRRRDDTFLQQQDGIQSAIAHCKKSFHATKGSESPLLRCMSDPVRAVGKEK